jgi:hypothetical protein
MLSAIRSPGNVGFTFQWQEDKPKVKRHKTIIVIPE